MENYIISCCSTADLTEAHLKEREIHYVCFHFELDGKQYPDDLGKSMPFETFYKIMATGAMTRTSQVNVDEFVAFFTPFLEEGKDILHVSLSSGLSGVYSAACVARDILAERYPQRRILVVDSLGGSSGYGLLVDALAQKRLEGMPLETVYDWAIQHRLEVHHWFFSTDLSYYVRGGRITKAAGWFGTVLNICPLLNVDHLGRLMPRKKVRTKKKVIHAIAEEMFRHARGGEDYDGQCFISHSACYEDARAVADLLEEHFPKLRGKVRINSIGTTIGSHTGPGTVALFFWGDERCD